MFPGGYPPNILDRTGTLEVFQERNAMQQKRLDIVSKF